MNINEEQRGLPKPEALDVLIVVYGGGHVNAAMPVAQMLNEQGYKVSIFAITTAINVCQKSAIPYFTYADLPQANEEDVIREGTNLAATLSPNSPISFEETRAYLGINFMDLVMQHGHETAYKMFKAVGRQIFFPINSMASCLKFLRPKLVITTSAPRSEHAALSAARTLGIPSLCIVDLFALNEIAWLKSPRLGTRLCLLNEKVKEMFIQAGRFADEIEVTGNPAFDSANDPEVIQAGHALRNKYGWGRKTVTILYASSPEPEIHPFTGETGDVLLPIRIEERLRNIIKEHPNLELLLRRHPSEKREVKPDAGVHASPQSQDIYSVIHAIDIVVVTGSTVGLQAYSAGVPVITVECSTTWKDIPLADFNMAQRATSLDALEDVLLREISKLKSGTANVKAPKSNSHKFATRKVYKQVVGLL